MALTLTQLQSQLDVLDTALGAGVLMVQHGETRVQYRSIAELRTARGALEELIQAAGGNAVVRTLKIRTSKGL